MCSISIHTPVKGVTCVEQARCNTVRRISIHTPVKGVTAERRIYRRDQVISIHTPVKGVTAIGGYRCNNRIISIHTPVKGVTNLGPMWSSQHTDFNPHTREGCDGLLFPWRMLLGGNFNPHTREGCDDRIVFQPDDGPQISIHTPVKGVTLSRAR